MTPPKRKSVDSKEDVAKNEPVQERRTRARGETMAADELSIPSVVEQGAASSSSPGPFSFYYFRKNCESCAKMDTYLNTKQMGVSRPQYRDAHKERVLPPEALTLAKSCSQVVAINVRSLSCCFFLTPKEISCPNSAILLSISRELEWIS